MCPSSGCRRVDIKLLFDVLEFICIKDVFLDSKMLFYGGRQVRMGCLIEMVSGRLNILGWLHVSREGGKETAGVTCTPLRSGLE